jgi:kinesin family member 6/9
MIANIYPEPD